MSPSKYIIQKQLILIPVSLFFGRFAQVYISSIWCLYIEIVQVHQNRRVNGQLKMFKTNGIGSGNNIENGQKFQMIETSWLCRLSNTVFGSKSRYLFLLDFFSDDNSYVSYHQQSLRLKECWIWKGANSISNCRISVW